MKNAGKLSVIFLRLCSIQKRPKFLRFGLSCDFCREGLKTDVWLCFFILSILSSSCATAYPNNITITLHNWLKKMNVNLEKSDASLYAPMLNDIPENCEHTSLFCYIYELEVIIIEEQLMDHEQIIYHFKKILHPEMSSVSCPPCEAHPLEPAKKFLQNLMELLQHMNSQNAGH